MSADQAKTWFITGANRGIGVAIARAALDAGHRVVATGRNVDDLVKAFPDADGRVALIPLDVTDKAQIAGAVNSAIDRFGSIDVLVNNAGYGLLGYFENMTEDQVARQFAVNLFGAMDVTRTILPHMRARRSGHVFGISSIAGLRASGGGSIYCSSKFALEGWLEGLAQEIAQLGIHCTIIEPGYFRTDFFDGSSAEYDGLDVPDYAEAARQGREFRQGMNHQQVGDPARLGRMMLELANMAEPPVRIAAGSDCSQWAEEKGRLIVEEALRWRPMSVSTDGDTGIRVN